MAFAPVPRNSLNKPVPDLHLTFSNHLPPIFPTALLPRSHQNVHILVLTAAGPNKKCFICLLFLHPVLLSQQLLQLSEQLHFTQQHAVTSVYTRVLQQSLQSFQGASVGRKKPLVTALLWLFSVVGSCGRGKTNPLPGEHEPCSSHPSRMSLYQQLCIFWQIMNSCHWNSTRRKRDT